jgi:hypothetical protein
MEKADPPTDAPRLPSPTAADARTERLAAALRANLKRRKAADRSRQAAPVPETTLEDGNGGDA